MKPTGTGTGAAPIAALTYTDRFVRELPGDPRTDRGLRQVMHAAYSRVEPTPVPAPELLIVVPEVAALLGLDPTPTPELAAVLGGNQVVPGMLPYAACYGGHQFGTWAGQLGDGRAITLGEIVGPGGDVWELQLKGAGPTPYSRRADGRAVLRSSLRELVCSEAMHHLGIPTTRALALTATGEPVQRDMLYDGHPRFEPGAITTRVAPSFLRFGSFELPASRDDEDLLHALVRTTLVHWYPHHVAGEVLDVAGFFAEVAQRTAWLIAEWMRVGFVHGVMNTDNLSILGLTIDYGPYGWLEPFDPEWTPNITDASGRRYRYGNQPAVGRWNLAQLARALSPLVDDAQRAKMAATIEHYPAVFAQLHRHGMLRKLGLTGRADTHSDDDHLLVGMDKLLTAAETDFTLWFRTLGDVDPRTPSSALPALAVAAYAPWTTAHEQRVSDWLALYAQRLAAEDLAPGERRTRMHAVNPRYVARNYLVQQVITATEAGDRDALPALLDVLRRPYDDQPGREAFAARRPEWARHQPGSSMLSCSS